MLGQQIARLEKGNVAMEDDGGQMKMLFDQPVVIEDSVLFKRSAERKNIAYTSIVYYKYILTFNAIIPYKNKLIPFYTPTSN